MPISRRRRPTRSYSAADRSGNESHTWSEREGQSAPRLPHERDESSDSQASAPRGVMKQAYKDVERGLPDTDRGDPMTEVYDRTLRSEP